MKEEAESAALSLMCQCIDLNYPRMTPQDFAEIKDALLKLYLKVSINRYKQSILQAVSSLICDVDKIKKKAFNDDE